MKWQEQEHTDKNRRTDAAELETFNKIGCPVNITHITGTTGSK